MNLFAVPLLAAALSQAGDDPAKLLKDLEDKVAAANTLETKFSARITSTKGKGDMKGTVLVAAGNKARLTFDLDIEGMQIQAELVSDGTKFVTKAAGNADTKDTPKHIRPA